MMAVPTAPRGADQVALALPDPLGKSFAVPFGLRLGTKRGKSCRMRRVFGKVPAFIPVCLQIMQHVRIAGSGHQLVTAPPDHENRCRNAFEQHLGIDGPVRFGGVPGHEPAQVGAVELVHRAVPATRGKPHEGRQKIDKRARRVHPARREPARR